MGEELDRSGDHIEIHAEAKDEGRIRDIIGVQHIHGERLRDKELAYLEGLLTRYIYWRDHYTPLAGIAEVRAAVKNGPRLDLPMPFIPPGFEKLAERGEVRREPVDDLRAAILEYKRFILLGDPGSGKTTTLWRLAYDYAQAAQQDADAPLPLIVPLGGYTGDGPFAQYLARHLGPLADYAEPYLASGRLALLLDGLNEMPQAGYATRVGRIRTLLDKYPETTVIVTCRALDYLVKLEKLQKLEVSPLDEGRIRTFLHNYLGEIAGERLFWALTGDEVQTLWATWQRAGGTFTELWTAEKMPENVYAKTTVRQDRLWEGLRQEPPPLLALCRNPYLLLMTAQVYANAGGELPANRAQVFAAFVDTLLAREKERHATDWIEANHQQDGLSALAYAMQAEQGRGTTVTRSWATGQLQARLPDCDPACLLHLATSATLLESGETSVHFYHQLLQEYFAARALGQRLESGEKLARYWPREQWWEPSGWEETVILLAGMQADASALLQDLNPVNPVVAARCLSEGGAQSGDTTRQAIQLELLSRMSADSGEPPTARVQAGDALAELDDPRFRADAWHLPRACPGLAEWEDLLGFVEIPAGPFQMGSNKNQDEMANDNEQPQHEVTLPAYYMAQYPVTVAQFRTFVENSGYEPQDSNCLNGLPTHPVVYVSWHDALAYCEWLTKRLREWNHTPEPLATLLRKQGWGVTLPSEAEWEKAARGPIPSPPPPVPHPRIYPWGTAFDSNKANINETGIGTTSAVGCFPRGASPYGILDLSGNVWEWTRSLYKNYPYDPADGRENLTAPDNVRRVLRGGSWIDYNYGFARCAFRFRYFPDNFYNYIGFRVVLSLADSGF